MDPGFRRECASGGEFPGEDRRRKRGKIGAIGSFTGGRDMMRSWIHFTRGRFVRQARIGLDEAKLREEHLSRQGFAGPVAMLYRTDGPNEIVRIEGDYRSRAVDSADVVAPDADDPRGIWQTLLANEDVAVAISRRKHAMPYCYRDMVGGHTPIDPTMLDVPDVVDYRRPSQSEYEVRIKHEGGHSSIFYKNDPLNV